MVVKDAFSGLLDGILQGHAIATQIHRQSQQDEAFERAKQQQDREAQLGDIETQMRLNSFGRPIQGGAVQDVMPGPAAQTADVSVGGAPPSGEQWLDRSLNPNPSLPENRELYSAAGTPILRPPDRSRTVRYKSPSGETREYELFTPAEQLRQHLSSTMATKEGEAYGAADIQRKIRNFDLAHRGVQLDDETADRVGLPRGLLVLPEEATKFASEAANIRKANRMELAPGATAIDTTPAVAPRPSPFGTGAPMVGAPTPAGSPAASPAGAAAGTPPSNPLADAGQVGAQNRADFVARARAAGAPYGPVAPPADGTAPAPAAPAGPRILYQNPNKVRPEPNMTEAQLAYTASHDPDPQKRADADAALKRLDQSKLASRPVNNNTFVAPTGAIGAGKATIDQVPAEFRDQVQQVLDYRKPLPPNSRTNRVNQAVNYWVSRVGSPDPATGDHGYDATKYPARAAYQRSLEGDGRVGQAIVSLNTAINHLGTMYQGAEQLDNSSFKKYNTFANWLKAEAGSDQAKPFQVARLGVSEELARLLKGGVATKDEVDNWMNTIDSSSSPAQFKSSIKTILELMHGRTTSLEEQHLATMGRAPDQPFVRPRAQAILDRIQGGGGAPAKHATKLYNGDTYVFDGQSWNKQKP